MPEDKVVTPDSTPGEGTPPELEGLDTLPLTQLKEKTRERIVGLARDLKAAKEQVAAYNKFGTPEQLAQLQATAEQLQGRIEQLETQREQAKPGSPEEKQADDLLARAKAELRKVDPVLNDAEQLSNAEKMRTEFRAQEAMETIQELCKKFDIPDDEHNEWANDIAAKLRRDPKLYYLYERDPSKAVEKIFTDRVQRYSQIAERQAKAKVEQDKKKLTSLPKPHGGGGEPTGGTVAEPKNVAEAGRIARQVLRGSG